MPFSWLYGAITNWRNSLYETGVFQSRSLGVKCVSVGNITVGGTGKTPMVAFIAGVLAAAGERVCILTRGYGRENPQKRVLVSDGEKILATAEQAGDEPFELAAKLLGKAVIVADANRAAAGDWAREKFGITWFVLDDAFQHRRVRRDLDVVLLDATNPFGNGNCLPTGILREPPENLKRADAIVITRANLAENIAGLQTQIKKYNSRCPVFVTENKVLRLIELDKFPTADTQDLKKTTNDEQRTTNNYLAFCALGNPANFFGMLRQEAFNLTATETFPDHHFYTPRDIETISAKARQTGANALLTTAKDAVKLKDLKFDVPCLVVESEMVFDRANEFRELILRVKAEK